MSSSAPLDDFQDRRPVTVAINIHQAPSSAIPFTQTNPHLEKGENKHFWGPTLCMGLAGKGVHAFFRGTEARSRNESMAHSEL